jgi:hypothetical protein
LDVPGPGLFPRYTRAMPDPGPAIQEGAAGQGPIERALPWLAILLAVAAHATWLSRDLRRPFWDQQRYYAMTLRAEAALEDSFARFAESLLELHPSHPPLYPLSGVLARALGARPWPGVRWVNLGFAGLLALATAALAARAARAARAALAARAAHGAGAWAAAFVLLAPLPFGLAHLYYTENLLMPLVAASWVVVLSDPGLARLSSAVLLGILGGLGLLTKWSYAAFMVVPLAVVLVRARPVRWGLGLALALLLALPWYLRRAGDLGAFLETGVLGGAGYIARATGARGLLAYPRELLASAAGPFLVLPALAGFLLLARARPRLALVQLAALFVPLLLFTLLPTKKPRHIAPLLPAGAALAALALQRLPGTGARSALGLLLLLGLGGGTCTRSFLPRERATLPWPLLPTPHADDPGPPDQRIWPYEEILAACSREADARVLVLVNVPGFTDAGLQSLAMERRMGTRFGLPPLHLPANHQGAHPFPLQATGEGVLGAMEADFVLARAGPMWTVVPSRLPVHRDAARLRDALLDPSGLLRDAVDLAGSYPAPDGPPLLLFRVRPGPWSERLAWLAHRAELVKDPARRAPDGIGSFLPECPDPALVLALLEARLPDPSLEIRGLDAGGALWEVPEALAARGSTPATQALALEALALMDRVCTAPGSEAAILELARWHLQHGHRQAARAHLDRLALVGAPPSAARNELERALSR